MTPTFREVQEALSHQHSHGIWLVGLEDGSFAVFDHPNGRLIELWSGTDSETIQELRWQSLKAAQRHSERRRRYLPEPVSLEDLGL